MTPDYSSPATDFEKLGLFLSTPLPIGNKAQTKRALAEAVTWLGRVSWLKREAEYHYRKDKNTYLNGVFTAILILKKSSVVKVEAIMAKGNFHWDKNVRMKVSRRKELSAALKLMDCAYCAVVVGERG